MQRFLGMEEEERAAYQVSGLNRILRAAFKTEAYGRLFEREPQVETLDDLEHLPLSSRTYLGRFIPEQRTSTPRRDLVPQPSTGTTGETMVSLRAPGETLFQEAIAARHTTAQRLPESARVLVMYLGMDPQRPLEVDGNRARIGAWAPVDVLAHALRTFEPTVISGPPSGLIELADYTGGFPVELLMTYGEVLTENDRAELKRAFGADCVDLYSASESGHISWQCTPSSGYHVNNDAVIVEIVDDDGRRLPVGETGHIALTTLWNPTMPIVRYLIGDEGSLLPRCDCEVRLPLMAQVEGRASDRPVAFDGRRVSPLRFALMNVGPFHGRLRRWRLVQRAVDDILVEAVWAGEPVPELAGMMSDRYSSILGGPVRVELRTVPKLTPRGRKFRWFETELG